MYIKFDFKVRDLLLSFSTQKGLSFANAVNLAYSMYDQIKAENQKRVRIEDRMHSLVYGLAVSDVMEEVRPLFVSDPPEPSKTVAVQPDTFVKRARFVLYTLNQTGRLPMVNIDKDNCHLMTRGKYK
jgi:hypothetical protein